MISHVAPASWLNFSEATENPLPKCQALLSNLTTHTQAELGSEILSHFRSGTGSRFHVAPLRCSS